MTPRWNPTLPKVGEGRGTWDADESERVHKLGRSLLVVLPLHTAMLQWRVANLCGEYSLRWETSAVKRCGCAPSRAFREGAGQTADTESRLRITRRRCWHPAALRRRGKDRKSKSPPVANARHASRTASKESPLSSPRSCQLDFLIGTKWGSNTATKQKVPLRGAGPPFAEAAPPLRSLQGWEHNPYDAAGT